MEWIERMVSDALSSLPEQELLRDPGMNRLARLAVLSRALRMKDFKPAPRKELKMALRREFQGLIVSPEPSAYRSRRRDITDHYGRILNLTAALKCISGEDELVLIAKAIRDEADALCDAYFGWCDRILDAWGRCIGQT